MNLIARLKSILSAFHTGSSGSPCDDRLRRGSLFEFEAPDDWLEERENSQFVFRGHYNEELRVSGSRVEGDGSDEERESIRRRLFENAVDAVEQAAAHPELEIIKPLNRDASISQVECWTLHAQTKDGNVMFSECIVSDTRGVLLITFEAPNRAESLAAYTRFLGSIRKASLISRNQ